MKFKLDENLPAELVAELTTANHEADSVTSEGLSGAPDSALLERIRSEQRVFLTMDKGIADVRTYPPEEYAGIILFRPPTTGRGAVLAFVRRHLPSILEADVAGHLLIVTDRSIRIR